MSKPCRSHPAGVKREYRATGFAKTLIGHLNQRDFAYLFELMKDVLDFSRIEIYPPKTYMSLSRSSISTKPSASREPISPVRNQPSKKDSAFASGLRQYVSVTTEPRHQCSPDSPGSASLPARMYGGRLRSHPNGDPLLTMSKQARFSEIAPHARDS